ncbi:MAG: hypothetical protein A2498_15015 [Lentisphaerae bacterium RIFOXYC12_FULL_60_16]|nr:MAG: hypothetical protein A2498_15015 [Lentisphaerae bacterium RIFOXYC12_FULL_60_16]OGV74542.1 MAG: hypothetical protein A2269_05150 [Lentisphaerae bacterium RIFOXYA12_FULL_60_10]OGV84622.1 MAG: hypothetical protein A2340_04195 [Lentisphaerae bacterium RIFOXYB12_FULL_60_10]
MTKRHQNQPVPGSEIILYQTEDGRNRIEVRLENETVWLTQQLMAELFQTTKQNIGQHLKNVFAEGELRQDSVVKKSFTTAVDGKQYETLFYNLDGSISHEMARELAESEYDKFHARRIAESRTALSDFDKTVKRIAPARKGAGK